MDGRKESGGCVALAPIQLMSEATQETTRVLEEMRSHQETSGDAASSPIEVASAAFREWLTAVSG